MPKIQRGEEQCLTFLAPQNFLMKYCTIVVLAGFTSTVAAAIGEVPADHAERMTRGLALFQKEIAPLLKEQCVNCHGGEKLKGDFDLATREGLLHGGAEGIAVVPFKAGESRLMKLIRHEEEPEMPEKKPMLSADVIAKVAQWIDLGAPYDAPLVAGKAPPRDKSKVSAEDRKWWSFQPLTKVTPPQDAAHPVDAFLLAEAKKKGLSFAPPADARSLLRRISFDLTGLPPAEALAKQFLTQGADSAPTPNAVAQLVDQLLAEPAFGERWARHWLDVARFAESSGFEQDYDRPHAYHFRDFVIKAFNDDMPFDQFARWQIAGDEFAPEDPQAMMATGFLGAGVFPTQITANEVERTRYDALDDMLGTTSSAFLGLSVACARCHDHKFDPIPAADYYRMASTFTTTVRANIDLDLDPAKSVQAKAVWEKQRSKLKEELAKTESTLRATFKPEQVDGNVETWRLLMPESINSKTPKTTFKNLGDGSFLAEGKAGDSDTYTVIATSNQPNITAVRVEALAHQSLPHGGPGRATNGNFALAKFTLSVQPATGAKRNVNLARTLADFEQNKDSLSIASSLDDKPNTGWAVDGAIGKDHAGVFILEKPLTLAAGEKLLIELNFTVNTKHNIGRPRFALSSLPEPSWKGEAPPPIVSQALATIRSKGKLSQQEADGIFDYWKKQQPKWVAANGMLTKHGDKPPVSTTPVLVCAEGYPPIVMHSQGPPFLEKTHFLKRGDTNQKGDEAPPGFLQVLSGAADPKRWQWSPPAGAKSTGKRRTLANWMTDVDHGGGTLMARVIVNRLWQHHFGAGLVNTPNDFGKSGSAPTHPVLLDWLASELIRSGWKLKPLHRLMMTSAAYQQRCMADPAKVAADPDNLLFLRRVPQRLEAEAVRDSLLAVCGTLDAKLYGPGTLDEKSRRRSIYFMVKRSQLVNSMVAFDAPEPMASTGARPTTTVTPQALLLMNSPNVRAWAQEFAQRVQKDIGGTSIEQLVARCYQLALTRSPLEAESKAAVNFLQSQTASYSADGKSNALPLALADFCQAILALNEFVYVN
jgi:mono/diheme cytochrome c family protein